MTTWHLSLKPDTDTDSDTDVDVNINSSVMPALGVGVGIGIGVESHHLQTAGNTFHLSILDSRVQKQASFHKVKQNEELRGGVPGHIAQATPRFDTEVVKRGHL